VNRRRGLTLTELLVVILTSSIIAAIALSVFSAAWRVYMTSQALSSLGKNLRTAAERISEELRWATSLEFSSSPEGEDWITITLEEGSIKRYRGTTESRSGEHNLSDASDVLVTDLAFELKTLQDDRVIMDISLSGSSTLNSKIGESVSTSVVIFNVRDYSGSGSSISYRK